MSSFDAAPLYQDLVAAITTLFTVYTEVQIKFTFFYKNKNAFSPGWPWLAEQIICPTGKASPRQANLKKGQTLSRTAIRDLEEEAAAVWWHKQWWNAWLKATITALLPIIPYFFHELFPRKLFFFKFNLIYHDLW